MTNLYSELTGVMLASPITCLELRLEPTEGGAAVVPGSPRMEQKRFQRQAKVLNGYLAVLRAERGEEILSLTPGMIPEEDGPEAIAAVWFASAERAEDLRGRLIALYNGFGSLPGGFPAVRENLKRWVNETAAEKLLCYVEIARREEDDSGTEEEPAVLPVWSADEVEELEQGLLQAVRQAF